MASGGNTANYNLYLDPAGVTIWGDNSGGTVAYQVFNGTPGDKVFTDFIYGIVPFGQDLAPGPTPIRCLRPFHGTTGKARVHPSRSQSR